MLLLSPIDSLFVGTGSYTIELLFHFPQGLDASRMRPALERVLEVYWPLRRTLGRGPDGRLAFVPSPHEVTLLETSSTEHVDHDADLGDLAPFIDSVRTFPGEALCKLQLTHVANGAVLGVSISHALTDGFSFFSFLHGWSQATLGATPPDVNHDRWRLAPTADAPPFTPEEFERRIGFAWSTRRREVALTDLRFERRRYTRQLLERMVSEGSSINDAVCADLWKMIAERHFAATSEVSLTTPVDFRRLFDRAPKNYIGNAVVLARSTLPTRTLLDQDLATTARHIRRSFESVDITRCEDTLSFLDALGTRHGALEEVHVTHPDHGLLVTNLSRLPVQQLDFGTGAPARAFTFNRNPGTASILPGPNGGIEVHITLPIRASARTGELLLAG